MSKYKFGRRGWRDPSSKYGLCPEQFEIDVVNSINRHESKKQHIYNVLNQLMIDDPARKDETFKMIIDWAREWRENK